MKVKNFSVKDCHTRQHMGWEKTFVNSKGFVSKTYKSSYSSIIQNKYKY